MTCGSADTIVSAIGIDISSGQPPSKAQMFKLAMSSKFRDGARKVIVELQDAGVDLSSKVRYRVSPLYSPPRLTSASASQGGYGRVDGFLSLV